MWLKLKIPMRSSSLNILCCGWREQKQQLTIPSQSTRLSFEPEQEEKKKIETVLCLISVQPSPDFPAQYHPSAQFILIHVACFTATQAKFQTT